MRFALLPHGVEDLPHDHAGLRVKRRNCSSIGIASLAKRLNPHPGRPIRRRSSLNRASDRNESKAGRSRMDGLCAKYWSCANSRNSPIVKFQILQPCRLAPSCRVWRVRERRLGMPGAARQKILAEPTTQSLRGAEPGALHFAFSSLLRLMRVLGLAILAMTLLMPR